MVDMASEYLAVNRAYEGDETKDPVEELGISPVVPPNLNRRNP